jgi:hypothetical protein
MNQEQVAQVSARMLHIRSGHSSAARLSRVWDRRCSTARTGQQDARLGAGEGVEAIAALSDLARAYQVEPQNHALTHRHIP